MSQRTTGLLTAALLSASPLALTALPASAATCTAPEVVSASASPRSITLGVGGTSAFVVSVSVRDNGCELTGTSAEITLAGKAKTVVQQSLALQSSADGVALFSGWVPVDAATLPDSAAGTWKVRTSTDWTAGATPVSTQVASSQGDDAGDDAEDESEDDESESEDQAVEGEAKVSVLRASSVSAEATSSALSKDNRIKKGKAITVKGVLRQTSWSTGTEQGYAKQRVDLQFRTTTGSYKKLKSLQTRSGGAFVESVKAVKDGCYRVVFRGSKTTAPAASAGECIDVR